MTTTTTSGRDVSSPALRALHAARELGRADGRLELEVHPVGAEPAWVGPWCHGRDPEGLAALVWEAAGAPTAGVVLNAPLWYAQGFHEALAAGRRTTGIRSAPAAGAGW